jgi:hypothetical protein
MQREFIYRPSGIIFYLFLILTLILTEPGLKFLNNLINFSDPKNDIDISSAVVGFVSLGLLFFTSEGVGYIFSSIVYAIFNVRGGYSGLFKSKLTYNNYRSEIQNLYGRQKRATGPMDARKFNEKITQFTDESLLVYFFWFRDQHVSPLDDWHTRRLTAYFTSRSSVVAILLAQIFGWFLIRMNGLQVSSYNLIWLAVSIILIVAFWVNGSAALKGALQVLDLWIAGATNPRFRKVLDTIHPLQSKPEENRNARTDAM